MGILFLLVEAPQAWTHMMNGRVLGGFNIKRSLFNLFVTDGIKPLNTRLEKGLFCKSVYVYVTRV